MGRSEPGWRVWICSVWDSQPHHQRLRKELEKTRGAQMWRKLCSTGNQQWTKDGKWLSQNLVKRPWDPPLGMVLQRPLLESLALIQTEEESVIKGPGYIFTDQTTKREFEVNRQLLDNCHTTVHSYPSVRVMYWTWKNISKQSGLK